MLKNNSTKLMLKMTKILHACFIWRRVKMLHTLHLDIYNNGKITFNLPNDARVSAY